MISIELLKSWGVKCAIVVSLVQENLSSIIEDQGFLEKFLLDKLYTLRGDASETIVEEYPTELVNFVGPKNAERLDSVEVTSENVGVLDLLKPKEFFR